MKFKMYSIYDRVTGEYGAPFLSQKDAQAVRQFNYLMSNSPMVAKDSQLFKVGNYDTETGMIFYSEGDGKPVFVCNYEVENG